MEFQSIPQRIQTRLDDERLVESPQWRRVRPPRRPPWAGLEDWTEKCKNARHQAFIHEGDSQNFLVRIHDVRSYGRPAYDSYLVSTKKIKIEPSICSLKPSLTMKFFFQAPYSFYLSLVHTIFFKREDSRKLPRRAHLQLLDELAQCFFSFVTKPYELVPG